MRVVNLKRLLTLIALVAIGCSSFLQAQSIDAYPGWGFRGGGSDWNYHYAPASTIATSDSNLLTKFTVPITGIDYVMTGDVDADGNLEIVTIQNDTLYVISFDGSIELKQYVGIASFGRCWVSMIDDANGDQVPDIGVGYWPGNSNYETCTSRIYQSDGTLLVELLTSVTADGYGMHPIKIIEGDIITISSAGYAGNPRGFSRWDYETATEIWHFDVGPAFNQYSLADIDGDGDIEMSWSGSTVHNGQSGNGTTDGDCYTIIIDEDGNTEFIQIYSETSTRDGSLWSNFVRLGSDDSYRILAAKNHYTNYYYGISQLHIRNVDGTVTNTLAGQANAYWYTSVCDVDGDGINNVVASNRSGESYIQYILDNSLNVLYQSTESGLLRATNDLTGNGLIETVLVNYDTLKVLDNQLNVLSVTTFPDVISDVSISDLDNNGINEILVNADQIYSFEFEALASDIRELTLTSTTVNGETQSGSAPEFTVHSGASITGNFSVNYAHNQPESHVIPLAATPNWGVRTTDFWLVDSDIYNGSSNNGSIDITAPTTAGTYYIILAAQSEYTAAQVLSATSWHESSVIWNDGNDLFDLSEAQLEQARANGSLLLQKYDGGFMDAVYGVTAIKIIVEEAPPMTSHFTAAWWPENGVDHMNFYILRAMYDDIDLVAGDEVGIYDGDVCVGAGVLTVPLDGGSNYLQVLVSSSFATAPEVNGFTAGNTPSFRIWNNSGQVELSNVSAEYTSGDAVFSVGATSVVELTAYSTIEQQIQLSTGWNILSFAVEPVYMSMDSIFKAEKASGVLLKVQDETGNAMEELPFPIGWINSIGDMAITEGYKTNVSTDVTLLTEGLPVDLPVSIPLNTGWNIMGYPNMESNMTDPVFDDLKTNNILLKVQDEQGNAIEELPFPIGWIDNIVTLNPGKGYKIKVASDNSVEVDYTVYKALGSMRDPQIITQFFAPVWEGKGLDHMNIYLDAPTYNGEPLQAGDELGIFDGEVCVGFGVVMKDAPELVSLVASKDDPLTEEKDGFTEDNELSLKIRRSNSSEVIMASRLTPVANYDLSFKKSGTSLLMVEFMDEPSDFLGDAYPNPSRGQTIFTFGVAEAGEVSLELLNSMGQVVNVIINEEMGAGDYKLNWFNSAKGNTQISNGTYFYRLKTRSASFTKPLVILD